MKLWRRVAMGVTGSLLLGITACSDPVSQDSPDPHVWAFTTPDAAGLDPAPLDELTTRIGSGDFGAISSLLIVRRGEVAYQRSFGGFSPDVIHPVFSVTTSVTSALIGVALQQGFIESLDQPVLDFFPDLDDLAGTKKEEITIRHLLTMRAGLDWDELSIPYRSPQNPTSVIERSDDWVEFVLNRPLVAEPGEEFVYNSGLSVLLGAVIRRATGRRASRFAREELFGRMGLFNYFFEEGPESITNTGWGLSMRPADLARFGQLYLNRGEWRGVQLLSGDWIDNSTREHIQLEEGTGYGFHWWTMDLEFEGETLTAPCAKGWGGQFMFVIPELDMVIVSTAEKFSNEPSYIEQILEDYILASVR